MAPEGETLCAHLCVCVVEVCGNSLYFLYNFSVNTKLILKSLKYNVKYNDNSKHIPGAVLNALYI